MPVSAAPTIALALLTAASSGPPAPAAGPRRITQDQASAEGAAQDPGAATPVDGSASAGPSTSSPVAAAIDPTSTPSPSSLHREGPDAPPRAPPGVTRPKDPFEIDLAVDLPIIGLTGSIFLGTELIKDNFSWAGCAGCDTSRIGPIDRRVLDNWNPGAATASDVLLYTAIGAPLLADLGDVLSQKTGVRGWGKDALILVEVFAVNGALTNGVKYAVGRPRPYSYGQSASDRELGEGDARLSFYSGHASMAFAMASAYGSIFQARHPRSRWRAPVWILGYGVASTTAVLRVVAGKHFWSDVLVGAIAGSAIGLLVPIAHQVVRPRRRRGDATMSIGLAPTLGGSVASLRGAF